MQHRRKLNKLQMRGATVERKPGKLSITLDNAHVQLVIDSEHWQRSQKFGYVDLDEDFYSDVRVSALDAQHEESKPRAPRGLARTLLCLALGSLVEDQTLERESIVVLEADPSEDNALVHKVYMPMGFQPKGTSGERTLMASTVGHILEWCGDAQPKRKRRRTRST